MNALVYPFGKPQIKKSLPSHISMNDFIENSEHEEGEGVQDEHVFIHLGRLVG